MEFNRNQYFMAGVVILLLGVQIRMVDSYVLNAESSRFIAQRITGPLSLPGSPMQQQSSPIGLGLRRTIKPPDWLGWAVISIGAVLILHSLAMRRPD